MSGGRVRGLAFAVAGLALVMVGCSTGGRAAAPAAAPTVVTGPATAAGGATDYCDLARSYAKAFERFGQPATADDHRSYYRNALAAARRAPAVAPAELRADVVVVADGLQALVAGLEGIDYDFARVSYLPAQVITKLMSGPFVESSRKVADHARQSCGAG